MEENKTQKKTESRFIGTDNVEVESKRIKIFLILCFSIAWFVEIFIITPMHNSGDEAMMQEAKSMISSMLFTPAIAVVVARLLTKEGMIKSGFTLDIAHHKLAFLFSWFGIPVLIGLGAVLYFIIYNKNYDPAMTNMVNAAIEPGATITPVEVVTAYKTNLMIQIVTAPVMDLINSFGEEWGFRGYLLPKLYRKLDAVPAVLISGLISGVWYAPVVALGYFYGSEYTGFPFTGILAMCVFGVVTGCIYSYVCLRTGSVFAAVFAHSSMNVLMSQAELFTKNGGNLFVGPAPTGIIGGLPIIVVAALCLWDLHKRPIQMEKKEETDNKVKVEIEVEAERGNCEDEQQ